MLPIWSRECAHPSLKCTVVGFLVQVGGGGGGGGGSLACTLLLSLATVDSHIHKNYLMACRKAGGNRRSLHESNVGQIAGLEEMAKLA